MEEKNNKPIYRNPAVKSFAAKLNQKRAFPERVADFFTSTSGTLSFAFVHVVWFFIWVIWNLDLIDKLEPFDPFPFGLLTMIVSLEAIFLAVFVLISQNRESKIDRLRSEVDLHIDFVTEQEITKILGMLKILSEKNGIDLSGDFELQEMLKKFNTWKVEKKIEKDLENKS